MRRGLWDNIRCEEHFGLWQFSACQDEKKNLKKNVPEPSKNIRLRGKKKQNKNKQMKTKTKIKMNSF